MGKGSLSASMAIVLTHRDQIGHDLNSSTLQAQVIHAATAMGVSWARGYEPLVHIVNTLKVQESKGILPWLREQHIRLQASSEPVPKRCVAF
jgi:hypothetical protein